jgi:hypothetical protein
MSLKITLTIDQENEQGLVLIGLLTKALGRGEAGVSDLRIERGGELEIPEAHEDWFKKARLAGAPKVASLVAKREAGPRVNLKKQHAPRPGTGAFLGLTVVASGVANANEMLRRAYREAGLSEDGAGATLSKLQTRGYLRNLGKGQWKLTAKGEAAMKEYGHEKVEHDGNANS